VASHKADSSGVTNCTKKASVVLVIGRSLSPIHAVAGKELEIAAL
jgi:hypothetical protein